MAISTIIFDLGGVLVDVDTARGAARLAKGCGVTPEQAGSLLFGAPHKPDLELGRLTLSERYQQLPASIRLAVDYPFFLRCFVEIFDEMQDSVGVLYDLVTRFPVHLLSNTDAYHYGYIAATYPFMAAFDRIFLSYELDSRKPDRAIYAQTVAELAPTRAEQLLFIDDREDNVDGARDAGWQAIRFTSAEALRSQLGALGIDI